MVSNGFVTSRGCSFSRISFLFSRFQHSFLRGDWIASSATFRHIDQRRRAQTRRCSFAISKTGESDPAIVSAHRAPYPIKLCAPRNPEGISSGVDNLPQHKATAGSQQFGYKSKRDVHQYWLRVWYMALL